MDIFILMNLIKDSVNNKFKVIFVFKTVHEYPEDVAGNYFNIFGNK